MNTSVSPWWISLPLVSLPFTCVINCHQINHPKAKLLPSLLLAWKSSVATDTQTRSHRVGLRLFFTLLQPTFQTGPLFPFFLHSVLQPDAVSITPKFSFHFPASISLSLWPFSHYSLFLVFHLFPASLLKVQLRCRAFMVFIIPFWAANHLSSL